MFLMLVLFAFAWRIPYAVIKPIVQVDEVSYSLPTVKRMLAGDWVFYVSGTNYGAPLQEAIASILFRAFGDSAGFFRFPTVLLGSVAVGVFFLTLRRAAGPCVAVGIGLLLALGNSSTVRYTTFAHSNYATLLLLVGLIQMATLWTDQKRSFFCWIVLGCFMGSGFYSLKLSLLQSLVSFAWLWIRSGYFQRMRERLRERRLGSRLRAGLFTMGLALCLLAPVLYHWLTRRATFVISPLETGVVLFAAVLSAVGGGILLPAFCLPRLCEWAPVGCCAALLVLIPMPAQSWFQHVEKPRLEAQGIAPYAEARYNIKHLHEWPLQARLMVQGVFPALIVGRWNEVRGYEEAESLGWKALITAATFSVFAVAGFLRWRRRKWGFTVGTTDTLFIAPFFLSLLVMFPSWSLHSDSSYRYLLPFLPGFYLLGYRCIQDWTAERPRMVTMALTIYVAYCAIDCFWHIA